VFNLFLENGLSACEISLETHVAKPDLIGKGYVLSDYTRQCHKRGPGRSRVRMGHLGQYFGPNVQWVRAPGHGERCARGKHSRGCYNRISGRCQVRENEEKLFGSSACSNLCIKLSVAV
jgi:hypothetical protein